MRTFKFRVWSPSNNKMLPCFSFNTTTKTYTVGYSEEIDREFVLTDENATIQQFTGVQDSEGVDIYEGDLIEYNSDLLEVKFENSPSGSSFVLVSEDPEDLGYSLTTYNSDYKVVGNIFEK